jgi:acyl carrier protein
MSQNTLEALVIDALIGVAPDIAGEVIDPHETFRDQFEIDSMDFLNFVVALNKATGVDIREADYPKLRSLDGAVTFLRDKGVAPE